MRTDAEQELFVRSSDGDTQARKELIERFLPLAQSLARRYERSGEPLEDLVQIASIGLIKAVDGYDPGREVGFWSYATPWIIGEIKHHLRDQGWALSVPERLQLLALHVAAHRRLLVEQLGRQPSVAQIATAANASDRDVVRALQASGAYRTRSLEEPRGGGEEPTTLADCIGMRERGFERVEYDATLALVLTALEHDVMRMRFDHDMTQTEIGAVIGVSQMQVSRILRGAMLRMHAAPDAYGTPAAALAA